MYQALSHTARRLLRLLGPQVLMESFLAIAALVVGFCHLQWQEEPFSQMVYAPLLADPPPPFIRCLFGRIFLVRFIYNILNEHRREDYFNIKIRLNSIISIVWDFSLVNYSSWLVRNTFIDYFLNDMWRHLVLLRCVGTFYCFFFLVELKTWYHLYKSFSVIFCHSRFLFCRLWRFCGEITVISVERWHLTKRS